MLLSILKVSKSDESLEIHSYHLVHVLEPVHVFAELCFIPINSSPVECIDYLVSHGPKSKSEDICINYYSSSFVFGSYFVDIRFLDV